jgi:RNA polymerase sigma-70 factor (ECF subfamily)
MLPDGYRLVFNLNIIEGYSHEEIGVLLGIQASTSRTQLVKARRMLQSFILKQFNTVIV